MRTLISSDHDKFRFMIIRNIISLKFNKLLNNLVLELYNNIINNCSRIHVFILIIIYFYINVANFKIEKRMSKFTYKL